MDCEDNTYKRVKTLGRGSFGLVYKAESVKHPGKYVAIKKYLNISKKDLPYQVLREINMVKLLKHPNIIGMLDIKNSQYGVELILEYGGIDLRSYSLRASYADRVKHLKNISHQIISGCFYMHSLGVIHRDLKPDNILIEISDTPIIKICDLGLAKKLSPFKNGHHTYRICTLCYRPPELFTAVNKYDLSVDVWSLGCVLYEFISQKTLFDGSTETTVLKSILSKIPTTQEDLETINLSQWKLESCNTEKFYKLPLLYDINIKDGELTNKLDCFKNLVQLMMTLNPKKRIDLRTALQHKFFENYKENDLETSLKANKIKYHQNFYVRQKLPKQIPEAMRSIFVEYIINWLDYYDLNKQTILLAINIFDQFICVRPIVEKHSRLSCHSTKNNNLEIIAVCCLMLASKYIDLIPIGLKNLRNKYSEAQLISWERIIAQTIKYDLNQPTLLNFYEEIFENKNQDKKPIHWEIIKKIITNYNLILGKGIQELKDILIQEIKDYRGININKINE